MRCKGTETSTPGVLLNKLYKDGMNQSGNIPAEKLKENLGTLLVGVVKTFT